MGEQNATDEVRPPAPELRILSTRVYRGPNYWSYDPSLHLEVDLGILEEYPTNKLPGFTERLVLLLPGLGDHQCSRGYDGGFVERLHEGTWLGHVAEHLTLQLQREAGSDLTRGKTRSTGQYGHYNVIFSYADERVARAASELAVRLINHLVEPDPEFDFAAEFESFLRQAQRVAFGPSTQAILDEAISRDIPWQRMNEHSLVQLGQGVHAKRIRATMTSQTSSLAVDVASDKELTLRLLREAGLPTPQSEAVRTLEGAFAVAKRIGYPVVCKPLDGNHGRGVGLNLQNEADLTAAFDHAQEQSRRGVIIVETMMTGKDYRVLVIGGKMVALAERVPAHVIGDGVTSIEELVAITNADPRRGVGHEKVLTRISIDDGAIAVLNGQDYQLTDVPPNGEMVKLALTGNMSTGGISIDRTYEAHPDNVDIAEEAASVVGLDIAGIDFICPDITEPVRDTGGGICEVNAAPGFRMHTHPTVGEAQYVAKPVVDLLFPPGLPSRIPIVAVTGTNGKTTTSRMIAHIAKGTGKKVGMTSTDGVVIDDRLIIRADASGPRSARMVLQNPRVDFAVFEVARGGILREGLGYQRNDIGVVLNVAPDHLGLRGIDTVEQLARVKRVVVEAVPRSGSAVLNADDPLVREMRKHCSGDVIWFSTDPKSRRFIERYTRSGSRAVVLESSDLGDMITIVHGQRRMPLAYTHLLPSTFEGKAMMNVQNAMAAAAAAYAAGFALHDIRQGLRTFAPSYYQSAGRLNMTEVRGVRVLVDYCHNAPGMKMLGDFVDRLYDDDVAIERSRRIGVIATAGDRRDQDMRDLGAAAGPHFDRIIIREDATTRGRKLGETAALVEEGLRASMQDGARCSDVQIVLDEVEATRAAINLANPGDLVVLCVDQARSVWDQLQEMTHTAKEGASEADLDKPVVE